jgi:hypothetical protein
VTITRATVDVRVTVKVEILPPGRPPIELRATYDNDLFPADGYGSRGLKPALVSHIAETAHALYDHLGPALEREGLR